MIRKRLCVKRLHVFVREHDKRVVLYRQRKAEGTGLPDMVAGNRAEESQGRQLKYITYISHLRFSS
jgi:hypothetical protein